MPPVARAILVHFWLAYDHPLPISWLLREAPARYTRAFLETETDDGDTTYFLLHQLGVIEQAIEDLETARADLGGLAERRLLVRRRRGRSYIFEPTPDLLARLKESGA